MTPRLAKLLLFLILLLLPSQLALHFWPSWSFVAGIPLDYLSPTLYLTDLLIFAALLLTRPRLRLPLPIIVFAVLNVLFSISPLLTLYKWLRLLEYFWLFTYLKSNWDMLALSARPESHRRMPNRRLGIWSLSAGVIWTSFLTWLQFLFQASIGGLWSWLGERPLSPSLPGIAKISLDHLGLVMRPYATFPHPNSLAGFLLLSALIIYFLNSKRNLVIGHWSLVIAALTVPITFSRSAIFLEILILGYLLLKKISPRLTLLLIPISALSTAWLFTIGPSASLTERLILTQKALLAISTHPLLGLGLGTFPAFPDYQLPTLNFLLNFQPVHNIYLLLASELGLPITVVIGYWAIKSLRHLLETRNWKLAIPLLVVLATGAVDHYWLTLHQNLLLLVLLLALVKIESKNVEPTT